MPVQRVLLIALALDGLLVVCGVAFEPEALRSLTGAGIVVSDLGLLAVIACVSLVGPLALDRFADVSEICLWVGAAFALAYSCELLLDFTGHPLNTTPYVLLVAAALSASGWQVTALDACRAGSSWVRGHWSSGRRSGALD